MKHIIILGDGMADWPVKSLGDKTLLQAAKTPYMDRLARMGRVGRLKTVADGFHPGSRLPICPFWATTFRRYMRDAVRWKRQVSV